MLARVGGEQCDFVGEVERGDDVSRGGSATFLTPQDALFMRVISADKDWRAQFACPSIKNPVG